MRSLEELDRFIGKLVKGWAQRVSGAPAPAGLIEIRHDILSELKSRVEPRGGGEYVFPYNDVRVRVYAPVPEELALYEAAFADEGTLEEDIRKLLQELECTPKGLDVSVEVEAAPEQGGSPYQLLLQRAATARSARPTSATVQPPARLVVIAGAAESSEFVIRARRVHLGRLAEVVNSSGEVVRRNDIAFLDTETSVSREHATLSWDSQSGAYSLCDSGSARGTRVFRDGRSIEVPRRSPKGVRLQSGDELRLGEARLLFELA
jgi:hypothetical protein